MSRKEEKRGRGRPRIADGRQHRRNVTLSDEHIEAAKRLGNGNVSEGIRMALDRLMNGWAGS